MTQPHTPDSTHASILIDGMLEEFENSAAADQHALATEPEEPASAATIPDAHTLTQVRDLENGLIDDIRAG